MKSFFKLFLLSITLFISAYQANAAVTAAFIKFEDPSCFGANDGYVTIDSIQTIAPTGPTYSISVNTSPPTFFNVGDTVFGLGSGSYTITIIDRGVVFFPRPTFVINEPFQISTFIIPTSASCFDTCDAEALVLIGNGTPPYTVLWSDPSAQDSTTAIDLCDGQYFVTVTDDNGCSVIDSVDITEPTQIQPNVTVTDVLCFGDTTGSAVSAPSGGSGTYTNWDWSSSVNNTDTEIDLFLGTFTVTVTDSDGCTNFESFAVDEPTLLVTSLSKNDIDCFGDSTGIINTARSGGTPPYTFAWSDGPEVTRNRTNLSAGTFTVTISDNNGCSNIETITLTQQTEIILTLTKTDILCNGDNTGDVTATVSGGSTPYSFEWSNIVNGTTNPSSISNLIAGTYVVTVTDNLNCVKIDSIEVLEPADLEIVLDSAKNPSCVGSTDGTIEVIVSGGTLPYTFEWDDLTPTQNRINLSAGTYTLTVTDGNSCTETFSTTLNDPGPIVPDVTTSDALCFGAASGEAFATPSGGSGTYTTYDWSGGIPAADTVRGLIAGTYTVTVTDSDGCTGTESFIIDQPLLALTVALAKSDVSCFGDTTGSINTTRSGGTPPYTYAWSDGPSTDQNRINLGAATYTVTVTDQNGCSETASETVGSRPAISVSFAEVNNLCNGDSLGSITATISGGTPVYSFDWSETTSGTGSSSTISTLPAGTYVITVTDALSCTFIDSVTLVDPTAVIANINTSVDPGCNGGTNGSATVTPGGGTEAYTFTWGPGNPTGQGTASISNLAADTYRVTVSDANGCTATDSIILTEPDALTINTDSLSQISCNGADDGFIRVSANGGTLNYTYTWPGPIVADSLANLAPGTYTVTVTDANSCTNSQAFIIFEPAVLTLTLAITDEQCAGVCDGEITANPAGGTTPYTYAWSSAAVTTQTLDNLCPGTYTVTVSDNNGCTATASGTVNPANALDLVLTSTPVVCNGDNTGSAAALATGGAGGFTYIWSNDSIGATINSLIAGTYTVTATDANGCDTIQSIVVNEPDGLNPTLTTTDVSCGATADGTASVATVGGTGAYTFNWAGPFAPITGQGTASISSLIAGTYTVTVSDNNGCDSIQSFVINSNSANFVFTDSTIDMSCFGVCDGFAGVFNLSGGTAPYTFLWDNTDTTSTRSALCQGNYSLTISDANSCDTVVNFIINEPDSITTNLTTIDESCAGGDGEADASLASGGTPPYTYAWSGTVRTTSSIDTLSAGTYTLTITDANNCEKIESFVINSGSTIDPRETIADVSCVGGSDGSIILSPSGGVAPYSYAWGGSPSTSFFRNALTAGDYIVTITDNSSPVNCVIVDTFTVAAPDTLKPTISTVDNGCGITPTGSASVATVGGTGAYTFNWAGPTTPIIGQGTSSISGLNAGTYTLTVSDNNGCDTIQTFTINSGVSNFTFLDSIRIDSCFGACNGFAGIFNLSGGTTPFTFEWDDASSLSSRSNLCAGSYTVTISDATGCDTIVPFTITELDSISATITANPDTCVAKVGNATAVVTNGGTPPYTFDWPASGVSSGNRVDSLLPGTYQVTITGSKGCSRVKSFVIDNVAPFVINITKQDISCKSADDGEIDVSSSGGTNPLTYTWSSGTTFLLGANPRNVQPGTFTLTLTDANGCAAVRSVTVTEPDTLEVDPSNEFTIVNDSSCTSAREGSAIANAIGGTPPYTYQWGPSPPGIVNDSLITGLASGTYFMTLTDANGCFFSTNFTIGSDAPFTVDVTSTDASCNGGTDGTIAVTTVGAVDPLTYVWNPTTAVGANPTGLPKGPYFLTVTDATGCSQTSSVSVSDASAIEDSSVVVDESCVKNDGSIKVFTTGGTEPYSYDWVPATVMGQGTDSIFDLASGFFRVTITDNAGCTKTASIAVGSGSDITVTSTIVRPTCFGDCDGSINVSPDGGVRPYTYEWSDTTLTDSARSNLCVGNYRVTISDGATPPCTKVEIISVENRPILTVVEVLSFEETCDPGMDGSAAAIVAGGTPPYTYDWDAGNPNAANANFDLSAGTHTVTVTDANGCTAVEPFLTFKAPNPVLTAVATDASCNGGNDGTITVTTSLGSNPFTYNWEGGALVGADPKNVSAGTYTLTVTDLNGCEGITSVVVGEATPITDTLDIVDETCTPGNDGEAVASPQGGTPPYTFAWPPFGSVVGNTISGLTAGTYEVTITDDSSCTSIIPFTIGSSAPFNLTVTVDSVTCHGGSDGEIRVTTTASNPTFTWALPLTGGGTTQSGLEAGSYFLTVTDGITGCRETETIIVEEPDTFLSNAIVTDVSCSGNGSDGEIDLNVSGGTSPYTYDWGATSVEDRINLATGTYTVTVTDSKGCDFIESFIIDDETPITVDLDSTDVTCFGGGNGTITLVTTSLNPTFVWSPSVPLPNQGNQSGLGANTYRVTVTDAITGCSATDSITINQPADFTSSIVTSPASCSPGGDGDAIATITGGTPPYTYGWGAGTPVGNSVSDLASGPYILTVTDRRGCSETFPFSIGSSAPFTVNVTNRIEPSCFGDSTGQFSINVVGAGGPLDYTWDPSFLPNQPNQVGLPAGTYLLTVTDQADGCTETATINLNEPSDISISSAIVRESCSPGTDGEIDLTVTGGTAAGAYTYNWSPNATNITAEDQTGLTADTYLVTVTDDNGCVTLDTFIVGSSAPFTVTEAKTDLDCFGDNDGTITITTSGPISGTLSYNWFPSQPNSPNLTGLSAGDYDLTITDSGNGCTDTRTITIDGPTEIMATAVSTPESCSPGNDGSLTLTVTGGTSVGGIYFYNWTGAGITTPTNKNQTGLSSGSYTVTITDDNGCAVVSTFNVGVTAPFDVDLDSTDVSCNGLSDGSILVTTTASNATYAWSPNTGAGNTNNPTGLGAGTYTVTVTEPSSGCAESVSIEVNEPGTITATLTATSSTCGNADGSIAATGITGGTAPITIEWLDASKTPLTPPQTGNTASNLPAGNYFAAFTDANNCTDTLSALVNDDLGPVATIAGTDPNCFNGCDGTATVTSACLSTTCTIQWRDNSGTIIGSTATISNLCAGTYFARVTDNATNCVTNLQIIIGNGTAIEPGLITESDGCSGVTLCSGTAKSVPTGGTAPYTFNWSGPSSPIVGQGTDSISELCAGNYDLTITDANGCDTLLSFTIDPKSLILPNADATNETCVGANDGIIALAPTGGVEPYTYNWSPIPGNGQGVDTARGLSAQSYSVTITDDNGCDTSISIVINSGSFVYSIAKTDLSCNSNPDGTADITIVGGNAGYSFNWNPAPGLGQGTANASAMNAGEYFVTISSATGCSAIDSVTINPSSPILPNEVSTDELCSGVCNGTITLNASGGAGAPYTYNWLPVPPNGQGVSNATGLCSGDYDITVTDASGCDTAITITINGNTTLVPIITAEDMSCNNSNPCDGLAFVTTTGGLAPYTYNWSAGTIVGVDGDTAQVLCEGNYSLTITDANGCSVVEPFTISAPPAITASFTSINSTCNLSDGSITVTAAGGTLGFSYEWFDSGLNSLGITTPTISAIASGIYFVDVTDGTGCVERFSTALSDDGGELVTTSQTNVTCFGGSDGTAKASYVCGDPSCVVAWFDGTSGLPLNVTIDSVDNLSAGTYFVQVTNNSGCNTFEEVIITEPDQYNLTATIVDAGCNNDCNGSISVNVTGGTGTITYNWAPGPLVGQGTNSITTLCAGNYSLTVSDDNGCDSVFSFTVGEPAEFIASFIFNEANCGLADGSIIADINGGTVAVDYNYQWFDGTNNLLVGETNNVINNISAGAYFLRVRDDNVCEERFTAVLGNTNGPEVVVDSTRESGCFGENDGAVFITATGNNIPFDFDWLSQGQKTEDITDLVSGTYTVQVTDALGCTTVETATIIGSTQLTATIDTDDASCGVCNGEASITMSGGTSPYTYLWSNGSVADTTANLCGGAHSVIITDANGCSITESFSINTTGGPTGETVTVTASSCATSCDGTVTVQPVGGTQPYTYLWQHNGATTNSLTGLCKGTYFLQVSDVKGCSRNVRVEIDSPNELVINDQVTGTQCNATPCEGIINLNVSGGVTPYTYTWGPTPQVDTNFVSGLCAGIYNVTVSDANGCSETKTITISNDGASTTPSPIAADANCFGTCDGSLISNVTPSASETFRWFDDQGLPIAAADVDLINSVCAGEYFLEVTSLPANCKSYTTVVVEEPDSITLAASIVKNISCAESCDGEVFISSQGGIILFEYSWSDPNSQTEVPATNLCAGTYTVTATDANGCSATSSVTLVDPPVLTVSISGVTGLNCSSDCDGSATALANGGVAPYNYDWDGGQSGANPTDLCFGPNVLTVTDATGCMIMDTVLISATDTVVAQVPSNPLICGGDSIYLDGTILGSTVNFVGWYEDDTSTLITNSADTVLFRPVGEYTFYLIASNGPCSDTTEYNVSVVPSPMLGVVSPISIFKDEVANMQVSNQDPTYLYNWNPGTDLTDSTIAEPISSTRETIVYTLTVRDTNNCTYIDSVKVIYSPNINIPSGFTPNGDGKNDVWRINILEEFPRAKVQVYNRWGELLYEQANGYTKPWDGTYNGEALPIGTYYYVVDFNSDRFDPVTGPITIVR